MENEFLLTTNGYESTWPSIEYGAWMAGILDVPVTLLGVAEHLSRAPIDDAYPLEGIFGRAVELFQQKGLKYSLEVQNGPAEEIIPRQAREKDCTTVIGPLGRPPLRRFLVGRSIRHFMAEISTPILYVRQVHLPLKKMLVCLGGLGYGMNAENFAIRVGVVEKAGITLLHVAPPVDLDYPVARAEREHWQDLIHTDTLTGTTLRRALDAAQAAGLNVALKARRGNVVEQILAEIREGDYDLVCMGSPYSTHGLRQMYATNVTDEVAESADCPILTARYVPEG